MECNSDVPFHIKDVQKLLARDKLQAEAEGLGLLIFCGVHKS